MRKLIWTVLFLFLFQSQTFSQETAEELKRKGIEIGLKVPQTSKILEEEEKKSFEIAPLKTISLKAPSYRVSSNPRYCAFSLKDGRVVAYDLEKEAIVTDEKFSEKPIYSVAFHPFKNIICFGDREGRITIFDLDKKMVIHTFYGEFRMPISDVKFSPDGTVFGVTYLGRGEISIYDTKNYEKLQTTKPHEEGIYYISFSPDSNLIASGSRDKKVSITQLGSEWPSQVLREHKFLVLSLGFSEDNHSLASGGADCQLIVWEKRGNLIEEKPYFKWVHGDWVTTIKFFKDYLITGSKDGKIRIFDFKNKEFLGNFESARPILSIDITPDGRYLFAASKEILIYEFKKILEKVVN